MPYHTETVEEPKYPSRLIIKTCGCCKRGKPRSAFNASKTQRDRLQNYCRDCSHAAAALRRAQRKKDLSGLGVTVESQLCRACKTHRAAEHFARDPRGRHGIDTICRWCRPMLQQEKGLKLFEPACELTDEEVAALVLLRKAQALAKRKRQEFAIDWTWMLDKLEAGVCEASGDRINVKKRGRGKAGLQIKPVVARLGYIESNCILVLGERA